MDYNQIIHNIIDSFIENKDAVMIRELPNASAKDITLLIVAESGDTARLIGKHGAVANAIREVVSVAGKKDNVRIHLKFESYEHDADED